MSVAIELDGVLRRFGEKVVLDRLTLRIEPGEVFSLLGPSGCGKTTTLRLVAGLDRPDAGTIRIGDREVAGGAWVPPEARGLGMVFQSHAVWPHRTVRDNVAYPLRLRGAADAEARAEALLARVHLAGLGERFPHTLSGGQQQRVAIARALATRPSVLLLDEPLSSLDAGLRGELRALLRSIARADGLTVLLVTHDQEEALEISDRVAVMREGRVRQVAPPRELYEAPADAWVARAVGLWSELPGERRGGEVWVAGARVGPAPGPDGPVRVGFRPEWGRHADAGVPAEVVETAFRGATSRTTLRVAGVDVRVDAVEPPGPCLRLERYRVLIDES